MPERLTEIPDFDTFLKERQAAKKEKKRAGIPWYPNFAAVKGLGVSCQIAAVLASKLGLLAICAAVSAGAASAGLVHRSHIQSRVQEQKAKQFNMSLLRDHVIQKNQEMQKGLPTVDAARKDTLGFVYRGEGLDKPDAAEAAAKAAAEAAAAKADAEKASETKGGQPGEPATPDANAMAAMLAQAQGAQGAPGAQGAQGSGNFGRLSSGFGARGGAGMAGGVGRGFDNLNMKNTLLAKSGGMRGGVEAGVGSNPLGKGKARNWVASRNITSGARSAVDANRVKSMSSLMAANRAGDLTKAAAAQTQAWDGAAAPGQSIQGAGASVPGVPSGPSAPAIDSMPGGEEGPMAAGGNTPDTSAMAVPEVPEFQNVTPYQWAVDIAKFLMYAAMVVAAFAYFSKYIPLYGSQIYAACVGILMGIGGVLAAMGAYMIGMGQTLQGLVWTGMGVTMLLAAATNPAAGELAWAWAALAGAPIAGLLLEGPAHDADVGPEQKKAKEDYEKKWGVDPDTGQVPDKNKAQFDERYGKGASDEYNKNHTPYST